MHSPLRVDSMINITSQVDLLGGDKSVEVVEFEEKSITLVRPGILPTGILLSLELSLIVGGQNQKLPAIGKIAQCYLVEVGQYRVRVQLRQFDVEVWTLFQEKLKGPQSRADKLFSLMKGEA